MLQDVTLADPVGLYIDSFKPANFTTPDGADVKDFWRLTRGSPDYGLRAEFEVPASRGYVVGVFFMNHGSFASAQCRCAQQMVTQKNFITITPLRQCRKQLSGHCSGLFVIGGSL